MKKKLIYVFAITIGLVSIAYATQEQSETNIKNVVAFYNAIINQKNFEAGQEYIGTRYIQHNPMAADGINGLKNYIEFLKTTYPNAHSEIKRAFAAGDYVVLHVHSILEPHTRGQAIVDIFKLEDNKIVEHWDVIQPIPESSANPNGMF